jgi:circadian clock protein KaiC
MIVMAKKASIKKSAKKQPDEGKKKYFKTGIRGFDDILGSGIPQGSSVLVAGGAGSGKTILCLQVMANAAKEGKKCLYMSFEESEERLKEHMRDFGWNPEELEKGGKLMIKRFNLFDISRSIEGMLQKARGEIRIDIDPILIPKNFKPDVIVVDSLTAISSTFTGKEQNYRVFIEQLFRSFERLEAISFLITETKQVPEVFSPTGVEEFLADGVIVLYNLPKGILKQPAMEVLKMRGSAHKKRLVAMQIVKGSGIEIYPDVELFSRR